MSLYKDFASHYDFVFPVDDETVSFLQSSFAWNPILDLGCATGGYAHELASLGYVVDAVDLDQRMIEIANAKREDSSARVTFYTGDIQNIAPKDLYGGVYCIGNTLVHLPSKESIYKMIKKMYEALGIGGSAVVQIVNYDRIMNQNIKFLQTILKSDRLFKRSYKLENGYIIFKTVLTYKDERYEAETKLFPIQSEELIEAFFEAGFANIEVFGDFNFEVFDRNTSFALVVRGIKE